MHVDPIAIDDRCGRSPAVLHVDGLGTLEAEHLHVDDLSSGFRIEADDTVHLVEFEVCPGLPCFDFRAYCRREWGLGLADAMAQAAAARLDA